MDTLTQSIELGSYQMPNTCGLCLIKISLVTIDKQENRERERELEWVKKYQEGRDYVKMARLVN